MIIAVDFDDTITKHSEYPIMGEINLEAIEVLKKLKEKKHILILWTCRTGEYLEEAIQALDNFGLKFDFINENPLYRTSQKIYADLYIDDRAFGGCVDWKIIEKQLLN